MQWLQVLCDCNTTATCSPRDFRATRTEVALWTNCSCVAVVTRSLDTFPSVVSHCARFGSSVAKRCWRTQGVQTQPPGILLRGEECSKPALSLLRIRRSRIYDPNTHKTFGDILLNRIELNRIELLDCM